VIFNPDGDLLFTCSKDNTPVVWLASSGERLGTYNGHNGAVWEMSCSWDSRLLATCSADFKIIVWGVESGAALASLEHTGVVRTCDFDMGAGRIVSVCEHFGAYGTDMGRPPLLRIYVRASEAGDAWELDKEFVLPHPDSAAKPPKITRARWQAYDEGILCTYSDGSLAILDPDSGATLKRTQPHTKSIGIVSYNRDRTIAITGSADTEAKLIDAATLDVLKTYRTSRPVNAAVISPLKEHVLLGGGQDAMSVTTTSSKVGKFETFSVWRDVFFKTCSSCVLLMRLPLRKAQILAPHLRRGIWQGEGSFWANQCAGY